MTWRIRFVEFFQIVTLVATGWDWLRHLLFPDGISGGEILIVFLLLIVWEEIMRVRQRIESYKTVTVTRTY
jgi:hypothetical protein